MNAIKYKNNKIEENIASVLAEKSVKLINE